MSERFSPLYAEIIRYDGDFGDAVIDLVDDPFPELIEGVAESETAEGLGVFLLCWLTTAIDNSAYKDALSAYRARVEGILDSRVLSAAPNIESALMYFLSSEEAFYAECKFVYESTILSAGI